MNLGDARTIRGLLNQAKAACDLAIKEKPEDELARYTAELLAVNISDACKRAVVLCIELAIISEGGKLEKHVPGRENEVVVLR